MTFIVSYKHCTAPKSYKIYFAPFILATLLKLSL